jgi:putative oxidoreductase
LRRLFSTFAGGSPGAGLLLMRLAVGIAFIARGLNRLRIDPSVQLAALDVLAIASGMFLIAGLWTPVTGGLAAVLGLCNAISQSPDPWADIYLAITAAALALLGPGAWSVDARLFGWKRIDVGQHDGRERRD